MTEGTMKTPTGPYVLETVVEVVSLRDQFAMAALPAFIDRVGRESSRLRTVEDVAKSAYEIADAMLAARKR